MHSARQNNVILIDAASFCRNAATEDEIRQNQILIQFMLDAKQAGFAPWVLFDDYGTHSSSGPEIDALSLVEDALSEAIATYNELEETKDLELNDLDHLLFPYTSFQSPIFDEEMREQPKDATYQNGERVYQPILHVAIVISPDDEDVYSLLVDDYDVFIRPCEMDSLSEFANRLQTLDFEAGRRVEKQSDAKETAQHRVQIACDNITFQNAFGNAMDDVFAGIVEADPIADFLFDKPINFIMPDGVQNVSKEEITLSHYFASLLRTEMCPQKAQEFDVDATRHKNELSKKRGGVQAAQYLEACIAHIPVAKPYQ